MFCLSSSVFTLCWYQLAHLTVWILPSNNRTIFVIYRHADVEVNTLIQPLLPRIQSIKQLILILYFLLLMSRCSSECCHSSLCHSVVWTRWPPSLGGGAAALSHQIHLYWNRWFPLESADSLVHLVQNRLRATRTTHHQEESNLQGKYTVATWKRFDLTVVWEEGSGTYQNFRIHQGTADVADVLIKITATYISDSRCLAQEQLSLGVSWHPSTQQPAYLLRFG